MDIDLYDKLVCALTHNIDVCERCGKCKNNPEDSAATIRFDMIEELAKATGYSVPWVNEGE